MELIFFENTIPEWFKVILKAKKKPFAIERYLIIISYFQKSDKMSHLIGQIVEIEEKVGNSPTTIHDVLNYNSRLVFIVKESYKLIFIGLVNPSINVAWQLDSKFRM